MQTKEHLIKRSAKLFAKAGYAQVSMRDIAAEVGIKSSSIYNHFASKEELFCHILDQYKETFLANFPTEEDLDQLVATTEAYDVLKRYAYLNKDNGTDFMQNAAAILICEQSRHPHAHKVFNECFVLCPINMLRSVLRKLIDAGKIPSFNVEMISNVWLSSFTGVTLIALSARQAHEPFGLIDVDAMSEWIVQTALTGKLP